MIQTRQFILWLLATALSVVTARADSGRLFRPDRLSSGLVSCLAQDHRGYIWVGTEYGLNKFDGYSFTPYLHQRGDSTTIADNEVVTLYVDTAGRLWVGSSKGLARYDEQTDGFVRFRFPDNREPRVSAITEGSDGDILVGTAGYGLYSLRGGEGSLHYETAFNARRKDDFYSRMFLDRRQGLWRSSHLETLTRFTLKGRQPTDTRDFESACGQPLAFLDYADDALLVVCQHGVLRYDYRTQRLTDAGFDLSLLASEHTSVQRAYLDHEGNIYLGTSGSGLMVIRRGEKQLVRVDNRNEGIDLSLTEVTAIMQDKDQNLWVGCSGKGLLMLGKERETFQSWTFSGQQVRTGGSVMSIAPAADGGVYCVLRPGGIYHFDAQGRIVAHPSAPQDVRTLYRDQQGRYWLGTETTLYRYQPETGTAQPVSQFDGRGLNAILSDADGQLYISVYGMGLYAFHPDTGQGEMLHMQQTDRPGGYLCNNWIKQLMTDHQGMLWIATAGGVAMMKPEGRVFNSQGWNSLLEGKQCYSMCETANGDVLLGTDSGLYVYRRQQNRTELLADAEPLQDKLISAMARDAQGTIWLSTTMGIWQLTADGHTIAHINGNGLSTHEYSVGAMLHTADDRIYFGTADGITTFMPSEVAASHSQPGQVYLTRLLVNGQQRSAVGTAYELSYRENNLVLEFSLLDYRGAENMAYQWHINGSSQWQQTDEGVNRIVLSELQPGAYRLEVRATNNGEVSAQLLTLNVVIRQPWYKSTWAYLCYLLLAGGFVFLILYNFERQRRRDLEESKMRFLINATHDIRSPLTLIMGAVEKLKGSGAEKSGSSPEVETIDRNTQRLLLLVNQILDERKIDKGQMRLSCRETNLVDFIGSIVHLYDYNARQRGITLSFEHADAPVMAWVDRTNFDKVVSNLLSNAFKYTFDGGAVTVKLRQVAGENAVELQVIDTGLGFDDDKTDRFFERFYQGKNSKDLHIDGTGIGLNLSRAITELHGGTITAQNRHDGQSGAILTVTLPMGNDHLKPDEIEENDAQLPTAQHPSSRSARRDASQSKNPQPPSPTTQHPQASRNLRILIVDDDPEIARYIKNELSQWYRFDYAENGREALKLLLSSSKPYDLVISDVMMPEMDGLTLLRSIKQNTNISHIPVILLTSKSEIAYRLEGLKKGADAYLAKPFSMEELHILIDNLVDNMRRLRGKFSGAQEQEGRVEQVEVRSNNDVLMERIMKSINEHLGDPDLNMEVLTQEVGISRAQLHRKMKEITGLSTTEFIRNLRLEQAARLIREKKINITQVAYTVGFNNQTHFSTVFKKHFGMTPTEYAETA